MGSTGTGNFSDYSGSKPKDGNNNNGGSSGEDTCKKAFSTRLEDVGSCAYFKDNDDVPNKDTSVKIVFNKRLIAVTTDNIEIGYLPTKYNYLKLCMDDGFIYSGIVNSSGKNPLPNINIDVIPE